MALTPGTRLGVYEVTAQIGEGGMGQVYRARDTKLGREVALKVLPDEFIADPERVARFQREAKTLASLNHPNIGSIYGLEEADGVSALVLELVEGPTLADLIAGAGAGPRALSIEDALPIARQIAEALEAAHEHGIIHRDLKPANVKVRDDGTVKVLDFGLAKALAPVVGRDFSPAGAGSEDPAYISQSPTLSLAATRAGVILGTAAYMSPEQAKGRPVDKRADIWAFGCVLFEMLTGKRAFAGQDIADTLAAVLRAEPAWTALPAGTPAAVRRLLGRCLEKDPRRRLRDIGEARIQIDGLGSAEPVPAALRRWSTAQVAVALVLAASTTVALGALLGRRPSSDAPATSASVVRFLVFPPEGAMFSTGGPGRFSVAPDGRQIAFVAESNGGTSVWLQAFDSLSARELPGTAGARGSPFWSPDSRTIAFFADGKLQRLDLDAVVPRAVCDLPSPLSLQTTARGSWSSDGVILFAAGVRLFRVSANGGAASPVASVDGGQGGPPLNPTFLPDGRHFIFLTSEIGTAGRRASGEADQAGVWMGSLDDAPPIRLLDRAERATYAQRNLLFIRDGVLMAQPFDSVQNRLTGEPQPIGETASFGNNPNLSASETGALVYTDGLRPDRQLLWVDRSGREMARVGEPAPWGNFDLSPDGVHVVASLGRAGFSGDIWSVDLSRGVQSRLTFSSGQDGSPVWSPDGQRIAFTRTGAGAVSIAASGGAETVLISGTGVILDDWSPDGRFITFNRDPALMALPLTGDAKPFPFVQTASANLDESHFSPDGKWIAYNSNESGTWQVYLAPFPPTGERWQISAGGGAEVRWRADGKELYYLGLDGQMIAVDVQLTAPRPTLGEARVLFQTGIAVNPRQDHYAVPANGQRFLLRRQVEGRFPLTVVLNWTAGLKK